MATAKKVLLLVFLIVLDLTSVTIDAAGWSLHELKCTGYLSKVEDCWIENSDLPSCNGKDPLVDCADEIKTGVRHCNEEVRNTVEDKYEMYKKLHDVFCEHEEIREEFSKKAVCWYTARVCASQLASVQEEGSDESGEVNEEECSSLLEDVESCNKWSSSCEEIQRNFTFEVFESSGCAKHAEKLLGDSDESDENSAATIAAQLFITTLAVFLAAM